MTWSTPKTNWTASDWFNVADYNRIKNNTQYIYDLARDIYAVVQDKTLGADKTISDYYYASEFNTIEDILREIRDGTLDLNIGDGETFVANGLFIGYVELNRIESAHLAYKEALEHVIKVSRQRLAFKLGTKRLGGIA